MNSSFTHDAKKWMAASLCALWAVSIFALIPLARYFQSIVSNTLGRDFFLVITAIFALLFILLLLRRLYKQGVRSFINLRSPIAILVLSGLCLWAYSLREHPERTIHFVQYGVLALLFERLFLFSRSRYESALLAIACASLTGTLDECVQWATPGRYFDYADIVINSGAAGGILLVKFLLTEDSVFRFRFTAFGPALFIVSVQFFLLALTFLNTPQIVESYSTKYLFLSALRGNPSIMATYGYGDKLASGETFISRFDTEDRAVINKVNGERIGKLINQYYAVESYNDFLASTLYSEPLAYEVRVRLFRRDAHWNESGKYSQDSKEFLNHISIAYLEHLILMHEYKKTYAYTQRVLSREDDAWMRDFYMRSNIRHSPVGSDLLTFLSMRQYFILFFTLCLLSLSYSLYLYWRTLKMCGSPPEGKHYTVRKNSKSDQLLPSEVAQSVLMAILLWYHQNWAL